MHYDMSLFSTNFFPRKCRIKVQYIMACFIRRENTYITPVIFNAIRKIFGAILFWKN